MFKLVKKHKQNKSMYSITGDAKKYLNDINLKTDNSENFSFTEKAKQIKTKTNHINKLKEEWKDKPLHGK